MKKQENNRTKTESRILSRLNEGLTRGPETINHLKYQIIRSNTFQILFLGKDPPGRSRSPGVICCLDPDYHSAALTGNKTLFTIEFQSFKKIQNPYFLTINILQL